MEILRRAKARRAQRRMKETIKGGHGKKSHRLATQGAHSGTALGRVGGIWWEQAVEALGCQVEEL